MQGGGRDRPGGVTALGTEGVNCLGPACWSDKIGMFCKIQSQRCSHHTRWGKSSFIVCMKDNTIINK